jgi:hypothetical protein
LECDQFTGRSTKTYKGGLKDLELKNKKITHYPCPCLYGANEVSRIQGTCSKGTDKRSCPCLYGANQVSRIQGTCSKGTDETVLTKFVTVTGGQTGQKAIHVYLPWKWGGGNFL